MEEKNLEDLTIEEIEEEYTLYTQKVVKLPDGVVIQDVKKAVAEFMKQHENITEENYQSYFHDAHLESSEDSNFSDSIWDSFSTLNICVKYLTNSLVLVRVEVDCDYLNNEKNYRRDLFNYIDQYLARKSDNTCPHCGEEIVGKGKFCANCGKPFDVVVE